MAWFFTDDVIVSQTYTLTGENARHAKVLRMREGEELTLIDGGGTRRDCRICSVSDDMTVEVVSSRPCDSEPDVYVTLYQALPKGDKMDYIVQKCVELGVSRVVPVLTSRCVSRPDRKSLEKKRGRWQKIALQAAMQSRRGIIPEVCDCLTLPQAVKEAAGNDRNIIFYELGGDSVKSILAEKPGTVGIFIGSEGGFEESEVQTVLDAGGVAATLGKRILRAETAPLAALSIIMYQTDNFG